MTDVPGQVIKDSDGCFLIKRGDAAWPLVHLGMEEIDHENMVIASGHFVGNNFYSTKIDVLS